MSRREIVVLVSRAFALIQVVSALLYAAYLPMSFMSLIHHVREMNVVGPSPTGEFWKTYYQVEIMSLTIRVAGLLILAILFWHCGPWVERILSPKLEEPQPSS
jgi:hypothetical protein